MGCESEGGDEHEHGAERQPGLRQGEATLTRRIRKASLRGWKGREKGILQHELKGGQSSRAQRGTERDREPEVGESPGIEC